MNAMLHRENISNKLFNSLVAARARNWSEKQLCHTKKHALTKDNGLEAE